MHCSKAGEVFFHHFETGVAVLAGIFLSLFDQNMGRSLPSKVDGS